MNDLVIRDVAVFDGHTLLPPHDVFLQHGLIAESCSATGDTIDGSGCTLIPGLIDSHTHLWAATSTVEAAVFGVTTSLDMFSPPELRDQWHNEIVGVGPVSDSRTAGFPATAPHGHGTEYGIGTPPVLEPDEVCAFVDAQLAGGADYIKIICDSTHGIGSSLAPETIERLVDVAHARGVLALAHIARSEDAVVAVAAGVDALMHAPVGDARELLSYSNAVLVPTLATLHCGMFPDESPEVLTDPHLLPWLCGDARDNLAQSWRLPDRWSYEEVLANVRAAVEHGATVLAGTDAGMPGTAHGASLHHELALLVDAGLTPSAALTAATSAPAHFFGLTDRGSIAVGLRADLVLVGGDPTVDITATRRIRDVWIAGRRVDHEAWTDHLLREEADLDSRDAAAPGSLLTRWKPLTDADLGGTSSTDVAVTEDPRAPGRYAIRLDTTVVSTGGFGAGYAGISLCPGVVGQETNFDKAMSITITARGDETLFLLVSLDGGYPLKAPVTVPIEVTTSYRHHTIPLERFGGLDLRRIRAVNIAIARQGSSRVFIDDIALDGALIASA